MGAPYNYLQDKAEQAVRAVIVAAVTGIPDAQVFTSFVSGYDDAQGTHSVLISAEGGLEDGFGSGNYRISVRVQVRSNIDQDVTGEGGTEVATHRSNVGKVFDALLVPSVTLSASLSAAVTDFTVLNSIELRLGRQRVENRKAISELMLEFTAVPSDVTV